MKYRDVMEPQRRDRQMKGSMELEEKMDEFRIERLYRRRWLILFFLFLIAVIAGIALNDYSLRSTLGTPVCAVLMLGIVMTVFGLWILLHGVFVLSRHRRRVLAPFGAYREMVGSVCFLLLCLWIATSILEDADGFQVFWQRLTGG